MPGLRPAEEHVRGVQTVEVAASGQAGAGQGDHGRENVQHAAGRRHGLGASLSRPCCGRAHWTSPSPALTASWRPAACTCLSFRQARSCKSRMARWLSARAPRQVSPGLESSTATHPAPQGFSVLFSKMGMTIALAKARGRSWPSESAHRVLVLQPFPGALLGTCPHGSVCPQPGHSPGGNSARQVSAGERARHFPSPVSVPQVWSPSNPVTCAQSAPLTQPSPRYGVASVCESQTDGATTQSATHRHRRRRVGGFGECDFSTHGAHGDSRMGTSPSSLLGSRRNNPCHRAADLSARRAELAGAEGHGQPRLDWGRLSGKLQTHSGG